MSAGFKININRNLLTPSLKRIQQNLQQLPQAVYQYFVSVTPKRSGNARLRTRLANNRKIQAQYPYATRLDRGWSRQAPQGMTKPTREFMKQRVRQILRKR